MNNIPALVLPAASNFNWRGWLWGIFILSLLAVIVLVIPAILRLQKQMARRHYRLELYNQGNSSSRYELQADAGEALGFTFLLNGAQLGSSVRPAAPAAPPAGDARAPRPTLTPERKPNRVKQFGGFASGISDVLVTVGHILPRAVGEPLYRIGGDIRRNQTNAERLSRAGEQLGGQMKRSEGGAAPAYAPLQAQPVHTAPALPWVETPTIEPGAVLILDVLAEPRNPYPAQHIPFNIRSQSLEAPEAEVIMEEGLLHFRGLTPFQKYGPFLLLAISAGAALIIAALVIGI